MSGKTQAAFVFLAILAFAPPAGAQVHLTGSATLDVTLPPTAAAQTLDFYADVAVATTAPAYFKVLPTPWNPAFANGTAEAGWWTKVYTGAAGSETLAGSTGGDSTIALGTLTVGTPLHLHLSIQAPAGALATERQYRLSYAVAVHPGGSGEGSGGVLDPSVSVLPTITVQLPVVVAPVATPPVTPPVDARPSPPVTATPSPTDLTHPTASFWSMFTNPDVLWGALIAGLALLVLFLLLFLIAGARRRKRDDRGTPAIVVNAPATPPATAAMQLPPPAFMPAAPYAMGYPFQPVPGQAASPPWPNAPWMGGPMAYPGPQPWPQPYASPYGYPTPYYGYPGPPAPMAPPAYPMPYPASYPPPYAAPQPPQPAPAYPPQYPWPYPPPPAAPPPVPAAPPASALAPAPAPSAPAIPDGTRGDAKIANSGAANARDPPAADGDLHSTLGDSSNAKGWTRENAGPATSPAWPAPPAYGHSIATFQAGSSQMVQSRHGPVHICDDGCTHPPGLFPL